MLLSGNQNLFKSKLLPLDGAFLSNKKYFEHKIGIQFNNSSLAVKQNNYVTKFVNDYITHDLDN